MDQEFIDKALAMKPHEVDKELKGLLERQKSLKLAIKEELRADDTEYLNIRYRNLKQEIDKCRERLNTLEDELLSIEDALHVGANRAHVHHQAIKLERLNAKIKVLKNISKIRTVKRLSEKSE